MMHNNEKIPFEEILNDNSKCDTSEGDVVLREDKEEESLVVVNVIKRKVDDYRGRCRVKSCLEKCSKKRV